MDPLYLCVLASQSTDNFSCRQSFQGFQGCFCSEQPWKVEIVMSSSEVGAGLFIVQCNKDSISLRGKGRADLLAAFYKILDFSLVWCSLAVMKTCLGAQHPPDMLDIALMGLERQGIQCKCETQACYAVDNSVFCL